MKTLSVKQASERTKEGSARTLLIFALAFVLGAGVSALLVYQNVRRGAAGSNGSAGEVTLSQSTLDLLQRVEGPIEIRYYSLLDPATVSDSVKAFAGRVDGLLERYQQAARGRIKVGRIDASSNNGANAALADGLKPFNQDKGDACYLGLALVCKDRKESLAQLSPEWEPALESDLSRAIARVSESAASLKPAAAVAPIDPNAMEEVKQTVPNYASVSLEEGTRVLRQAALTDFSKVAAEMEARIKEAEQRFQEAEKNQSEEGRLAARQQIQQLQAEQNQKLKQIVARSQAQIEALQQLKAGGK